MSKKIEMNLSARERNERAAKDNQTLFKALGLRVLNLIGSPGCGKTTLLEKSAAHFKDKMAVIEGDVFTSIDAERILKHGSRAVQIETGGGCHLNAEQVRRAFDSLDKNGLKILIIENVGNLVCPSTYELGEAGKVAFLSLPEGDEKIVKYPALFMRAEMLIISKVDLKEVLDFNIDRVREDVRKLNPDINIIELSAKTGEGLPAWFDYLAKGR